MGLYRRVRQFLRGTAVALGVVVVASLAFVVGLLWGSSPERDLRTDEVSTDASANLEGAGEDAGDQGEADQPEPTEPADGAPADDDTETADASEDGAADSADSAESGEGGDVDEVDSDEVTGDDTDAPDGGEVVEGDDAETDTDGEGDDDDDDGEGDDGDDDGDNGDDDADGDEGDGAEDDTEQDDTEPNGDGVGLDGDGEEANGASRFFRTAIPDGWELTRIDQELSYGWRNEYRGPDGARIRVEVSNTQPPPSAIESAQAIGGAVGDRLTAGPERVDISGFANEVYRIEFRGLEGDNRADYFLVEGGRGYAVLAITDNDLGPVDEAARRIIGNLQTTG